MRRRLKPFIFFMITLSSLIYLFYEDGNQQNFKKSQKSGHLEMPRSADKKDHPHQLTQSALQNHFNKKIQLKRNLSNSSVYDKNINKNMMNELKAKLKKFPQKAMGLFDHKYSIVDGVFASFKRLENQDHLMKLSGYYLYSDPFEGASSVFYSQQEDRFGVFTGEVVIKGPHHRALSFVQQNHFEILLNNKSSQMIIIKVSSPDELESLEKEALLNFLPDVKFGRKHQI